MLSQFSRAIPVYQMLKNKRVSYCLNALNYLIKASVSIGTVFLLVFTIQQFQEFLENNKFIKQLENTKNYGTFYWRPEMSLTGEDGHSDPYKEEKSQFKAQQFYRLSEEK